MNEVPLEEAEFARKAFGDLADGERDVVREALALSRSGRQAADRTAISRPLAHARRTERKSCRASSSARRRWTEA